MVVDESGCEGCAVLLVALESSFQVPVGFGITNGGEDEVEPEDGVSEGVGSLGGLAVMEFFEVPTFKGEDEGVVEEVYDGESGGD